MRPGVEFVRRRCARRRRVRFPDAGRGSAVSVPAPPRVGPRRPDRPSPRPGRDGPDLGFDFRRRMPRPADRRGAAVLDMSRSRAPSPGRLQSLPRQVFFSGGLRLESWTGNRENFKSYGPTPVGPTPEENRQGRLCNRPGDGARLLDMLRAHPAAPRRSAGRRRLPTSGSISDGDGRVRRIVAARPSTCQGGGAPSPRTIAKSASYFWGGPT